MKEELHGSSDDETSSFQAEVTASFNNNRTTTHNMNEQFQRMYINEEESNEEEEPQNSDGPNSMIFSRVIHGAILRRLFRRTRTPLLSSWGYTFRMRTASGAAIARPPRRLSPSPAMLAEATK